MTPAPQLGYHVGQAVFCFDEYVELLKARKRVSEAFSQSATDLIALFLRPNQERDCYLHAFQVAFTNFLTVDIDASLEGIARNPTNQKPPGPPVTVEDLAGITLECEIQEQRVQELESALERAPEEIRAIMRAGMLPMLEYQLNAARQKRDRMQQAFDQQGQDRPPSSEPA
jgi:hypothetical protein